MHVHQHGYRGSAVIYTYEVAETKVTQVMDFARKHQHPLQCVMEKGSSAGAYVTRTHENQIMPTFSRSLEQSLHRGLGARQ